MFHYSKAAAKKAGAATVAAQNYQFSQLVQARNAAVEAFNGRNMMTNLTEQMNKHNRALGINAVTREADLYEVFDQQVQQAFTQPDELTIFNDLAPLAKSVGLTDMVYKFARNGGQGPSKTSMSGQTGLLLDTPDFDFDGTLVPIHDNGFKFEWRSPLMASGQSLLAIADIQAGKVTDLKRQINKGYFEGWKDASGSYITFDGQVWKGFRNDSRVGQFTLTTDLLTADIETAKKQFIALRDHSMITNRVPVPSTYYISQEMASAFEQRISNNYAAPSFMVELATLRGVAAIKVDASLTGNEILVIPLQSNLIAPINGAAIATVANPRMYFNSDYTWQTWGASGLMVKTDYFGCTPVIMATSESGS